ncbi:hypothetical protein JHK85_019052 [Glycine max]|uniref:GDSL esterase/lipase CPRD49 n=1 Tax=Glycine soja TaxID=3848 RepID=A0A0B2SU84_GLYSO|nr:hypothetical protein JHK85_019052 [Glycine max]KHN48498.1 GDSL esterase/lipase CPRD49 [Glycine soja]RZC03023.1 GDSL esterase/lipase CPRD49 [Glycine soja]
MLGTSRPQFVLFGSSIVQYSYYEGWGATLSHLYARKADIVLRGYAAWNSRRALQVLDTIFPKDAKEQPSLVIVYFGGNDSTLPNPNGLGPHVPVEEYKENMRKIAIHMKCLSEKTRTIFLTTPPINEAQIHNNSDGIHLSTEGSKIVTKEILKVLKEAEWEPSLYWRSMPSDFGEDSPYDPVGPDGKSTINLSNFAFPNNDQWD